MLLDFGIQFRDDLALLFGIQLLSEPPDRDSNHIPVMKPGPEALANQFQPEPVHQIDIFRP